MIKIMLDPGHGAGKSHNRGFVQVPGQKNCNEGDQNFIFCQDFLKPELEKKGFIVSMTRNKITDNPSFSARGKSAAGYDLFLSWHSNAGGGTGSEVYDDTNPKYSNKKLASMLSKTCADTLGIRDRGAKYRRQNNGSNYYAVLRYNYAKNGMIVEAFFHDNLSDAKKYFTKREQLAKNVANTLSDYYGIKTKENRVTIMGKAKATAEQMVGFLLENNPNPKINCSPEELAELFLREGEIEGVRGDIAFAQSIKETGYFKYGGDVVPEQNNFAGIGTTGGGIKGAYFETPQIGVQAQIQHLKAYASTEPLVQKCVDPRFDLVQRGTAPYVTDLNGKWAVPGNGYGESILVILDNILNFKPLIVEGVESEVKDKVEEIITGPDWEGHWAEEDIQKVMDAGLMIGYEDGSFKPNENATRAELATVLNRLGENQKK